MPFLESIISFLLKWYNWQQKWLNWWEWQTSADTPLLISKISASWPNNGRQIYHSPPARYSPEMWNAGCPEKYRQPSAHNASMDTEGQCAPCPAFVIRNLCLHLHAFGNQALTRISSRVGWQTWSRAQASAKMRDLVTNDSQLLAIPQGLFDRETLDVHHDRNCSPPENSPSVNRGHEGYARDRISLIGSPVHSWIVSIGTFLASILRAISLSLLAIPTSIPSSLATIISDSQSLLVFSRCS